MDGTGQRHPDPGTSAAGRRRRPRRGGGDFGRTIPLGVWRELTPPGDLTPHGVPWPLSAQRPGRLGGRRCGRGSPGCGVRCPRHISAGRGRAVGVGSRVPPGPACLRLGVPARRGCAGTGRARPHGRLRAVRRTTPLGAARQRAPGRGARRPRPRALGGPRPEPAARRRQRADHGGRRLRLRSVAPGSRPARAAVAAADRPRDARQPGRRSHRLRVRGADLLSQRRPDDQPPHHSHPGQPAGHLCTTPWRRPGPLLPSGHAARGLDAHEYRAWPWRRSPATPAFTWPRSTRSPPSDTLITGCSTRRPTPGRWWSR